MKNQNIDTVYEVLRIKQVVQESEIPLTENIIRSPHDGARIASHFIGDDDREVFFVICLNTKNRVIAVHRCHVGSINSSIVHPREVFKAAILNNASSIIISHQHPSGDISPSREDINVTRRIKEAGELMGIEMLDHVIVSSDPDNYFSMKEKGYC